MPAMAPLLAFTAGILSSVGPCLTIRLGALGGLVNGAAGMRRVTLVLSFASGIVVACMALTCSAVLLRGIVAASPLVYASVAAGFVWFGLRSLVHSGCAPREQTPARAGSSGLAFIQGCGLGLIVSPCCTPIVASMALAAALATTRWNALAASMLFACGHVTPIVAAGLATWRSPSWIGGVSGYAATVMGGVFVSLGMYYALLA